MRLYMYDNIQDGFTLCRTMLYRAFNSQFHVGYCSRRESGKRRFGVKARTTLTPWQGGRAVCDWTGKRQMPSLPPPSSPEDGLPDDFPDIDKHSCRLLGPTALVRTDHHPRLSPT